MPITEVELKGSGFSGTATGGQGGIFSTSYQAQYKVTSSDLLAPSWILYHFQQAVDLPWPDRFYNIAGGYDVFSICKTITANYVENSKFQYIVNASYEPSQGSQQQEEKQDENGKNQSNPLLWADEIDISYYPVSVPVEAGQFAGFDPPTIQNRFLTPGQITPIVNSAMTPFDPTLEDEAEIKVIRITKYSKQAQQVAFNDYIGALNNDDVFINKPRYGYTDRFSKFRGRIKGLNATFAITNGIPHFRQTIEVHVSPLLYGWFRPVIDRGIFPRRAAGDPDGKGGTVSHGDLAQAGIPTSGVMQDTNGVPLGEPVLFDGNGQPLKTGPGARPVVMVYNVRKLRPFSPIRW